MANKTNLWRKFGRYLSGLVLACFFLPFFGVSCGGMEIVTVSGADMVGGCKPGGLLAEGGKAMGGGGEEDSMSPMPGGKATVQKVDREPFAILAMAAAVGLIVLSMVKTRKALLATVGVAGAGLLFMILLYVKINGKLKDAVDDAKKLGTEGGGHGMGDAAQAIDAGARMGFFVVAIGFIAIGGLVGAALREPEGGTTPLTPPPMAGGYPPPPAA